MIAFLETRAPDQRRFSGLAFAFAAAKTQAVRKPPPPVSLAGEPIAARKASMRPGRGRVRRGEERATPDLPGIVEEPLARGVDQARARFLEQKIGGGDVPIVRVLGRDGEIDRAARRHAQAVGERGHTRNDLDRGAELRRHRLNDELGAGGGARRPAGGGG